MRLSRVRFTGRVMMVWGVLALVAVAFLLGIGVGKGNLWLPTAERRLPAEGQKQQAGQSGRALPANLPKGGAQPGSTGMPAVQAEGTHLSVLDSNGTLVWELEAAVVEGRDDNQSVSLKQVKARRYEKGRVVATVSAPDAILLSGTGEVRFSGGVAARVLGSRKEPRGSQGAQGTPKSQAIQDTQETRLEAMKLAWDPQRQVLVAEGRVMMQQGLRIMTGDKLTGDGNLQKVRMEGHVKVRSYQVTTGETGVMVNE